jgi:hypothetical protein
MLPKGEGGDDKNEDDAGELVHTTAGMDLDALRSMRVEVAIVGLALYGATLAFVLGLLVWLYSYRRCSEWAHVRRSLPFFSPKNVFFFIVLSFLLCTYPPPPPHLLPFSFHLVVSFSLFYILFKFMSPFYSFMLLL